MEREFDIPKRFDPEVYDAQLKKAKEDLSEEGISVRNDVNAADVFNMRTFGELFDELSRDFENDVY